jgi:diguanylate cyclase (GGDEF)-like protein/PAS domain S-box-containing protein
MTDGNNPRPNDRAAAPSGLHGLLLTGFVLSLLLPILFALLVWYDLDREDAYAIERAHVIVQSVQRQLGEQLSWLADDLQQDADLDSLQASVAATPTRSRPSRKKSDLDAAMNGLVLVHDGIAVDRRGRPADASWLPPPDPDARPAGLSIGAPIRDAASGRAVVPVAWDARPGLRLGARVDDDWFAAALAGYQLNAGSILNLVHRDGVLLARSEDNQRYAGRRLDRAELFDAAHRRMDAGDFIESGVIDGVRRQFVFQRVPHSPLIVVVGQARHSMLTGWRRFAVVALSASLLLGLLWWWLSRAFARSHARQAQLVADLRAQSQRAEEARRIAALGDWTWSLDSGEVLLSEEIFAILGLPPRQGPVRIEQTLEWVHADDRERLREYLDHSLAGGDLVETEFRRLRADGEARVVRVRGEWLDRSPGQRVLRGILQDVTELANARERLQQAQMEYRFLFKNNPLPMCVYDRATLMVLAVNKAFLDAYGYTREEILDTNILDIRPAEEIETARTLLMVPPEEYPQGRVWTHCRKDGTRMRMRVFGQEIDFDGHPSRLVVLQDVTESEVAEQRFQLVARATSDAVWDWDLETDITWRSDNVYPLFGYDRDEIGGTLQGWSMLLHPDDRQRVLDSVLADIESGATEWECTYRFLRKDGTYADVLDRGFILRDESGHAFRAVGGMLDITQKHQDEANLRLLRRAMESADNGIAIADARLPGLPMVYVNRAYEKMTGKSAAELLGSPCRFMEEGDSDQPELIAIRQAIVEQRELRILLHDRRANGERFWNDFYLAPVLDDNGVLTHFVSIQSDVSERQRILDQLAYRATYDELTGLPNRQLLADRLQQAVLNAERHQRGVGVLFVDLDEFKLINDTMGHSAGDEALRTVAKRFASAVRGSDTVGRFGGDEFVAILTEQTDEEGVARVIERFNVALAQPVEIAGVPHYVSASIGYCRFPEGGSDAETLLKHADMAMYQAKQQGRNRAVAYRAEFDVGISERLHLVSALRDALQREEFRLFFQPLFGHDGNAVGMEALLRWQHPQRGLLLPDQFIGLCEDSGFIVPIGRWVLHEAARHHAQLVAHGLGHLRIAVNVSAVQFQPGLYDDVHSAIAAHDLPHDALELELTESVIMDNPETAIEIMRRLDAIGVSISVDDFGTGYSSLTYLKRLPIARLKIDRSFVDQLGQNSDDDAICTSIIHLAHSLGLRTVAEGIETPQQLEWLRIGDCDEFQGYLLGRPLPFAEMLVALGRR